MSAAGSIIAQCAECCECPTATVEWDSRSASKTKCGYLGKDGLIYLSADGSGSIISGGFGCGSVEHSVTGSLTITPPSCAAGSDMEVTCTWEPACGISPTTDPVPPNASNTSNSDYLFPQLESLAEICSGFRTTTRSSTSNTISVTGTGSQSGTITFTFSNEYTTATLKSNTVAALPAYDNDWNDTVGSFANLSTDELSYSIRESRYRFRFKIPLVGFGTCYKMTWIERFTPEGGGAVTDTPRCTIWDGATPGGYVPSTPSTYPVLPSASPFYFELPVPTSDGTTTVENVVAECLRCTACP